MSIGWDWVLLISTQNFARAKDFRRLIAMRAHPCLAERHIFIHYAKFKMTKRCNKITLHRMVLFFLFGLVEGQDGYRQRR